MVSLLRSDPLPPPPPAFNMAQYVLTHAARLADKPALIHVSPRSAAQVIDYQTLQARVQTTATGLLRHAKPGDHILLDLGNTITFPTTFLGAIAAGLVPVIVSSQLTEPERQRICTIVNPRLIIGRKTPCPNSHHISGEDLSSFKSLAVAPFDLGDPNRPAYIVFTSGTSGTPRAVVHAHRAIWARQMMWDGWYGLREDDRIMHAGAFNWTYTLGTGLMDPWSKGATALVPADGTPPDALPHLMAHHRVTIFAAAPGVYRRLLRADIPPLPNLRHGLSAGEKLTESFRSEWHRKTGTLLHEAFGMSECSTFLSGNPAKPAPSGTLGHPQPGRQIAILGGDGPVPRGQPGIIAIHKSDPGLMLGYLDAPLDTAAKYQGDWFLTGDIGTMDDAGAITYAGRADDMMNAGGYRVSPIEVESALITHPAITEAAACAVQIRTGTQIIAAFYVATNVIDEDKLRSFMDARLASYKCPRLYVAKDTLPRGANNKLLRRTLRQEWETEHGQT